MPAFDVQALIDTRNQVAASMELRGQQGGRVIDAHTPGTGYTEIVNGIAALKHALSNDIAHTRDQIRVDTMTDATLKAKAAEKGITEIPAEFASGLIDATGSNGATIPLDSIYQHANGNKYRVTAATIIVAGVASVPVIAITAGVADNLIAGVSLSLTATINGIDSTAAVSVAGITGGADVESTNRLRERYKERLNEPSMGGSDADYITWAKQAHVDITRAFIFKHENGVGTIVLRVVTEDLATPIPTQPIIDIVTAYINAVNRRPSGAVLTVEAPTAQPLNLEFTSLESDTPEVRAAIDAELQDLLRTEGKSDTVLKISHIRAAISNAAGEDDYAITLNANVVVAADSFPTLGVTTWPS